MYLLILFLLTFFDYLSKKLIYYILDLHQSISILFFLDFIHIHNFGIAFGLFANVLSDTVIIFIGFVVTSIIIFIMLRTQKKIEKWGYLLIICGAVSNLLDRLINGYVLDFIYFNYNNFYWPAFNFADIYITIGVIMILFQFLRDSRKKVLN